MLYWNESVQYSLCLSLCLARSAKFITHTLNLGDTIRHFHDLSIHIFLTLIAQTTNTPFLNLSFSLKKECDYAKTIIKKPTTTCYLSTKSQVVLYMKWLKYAILSEMLETKKSSFQQLCLKAIFVDACILNVQLSVWIDIRKNVTVVHQLWFTMVDSCNKCSYN